MKKSKLIKSLVLGTASTAVISSVALATTTGCSNGDQTKVSATITFNEYNPSMGVGTNQTISALSTSNNPVNLTATGEGKNINFHFDESSGLLQYDGVAYSSTQKITITASDGVTTQSIYISMLTSDQSPTPTITFGAYNASMKKGESQTISATSTSGSTITLDAIGDGKGTDYTFEAGVLTYLLNIPTGRQIQIIATDGGVTQSIYISLLSDASTPGKLASLDLSSFVLNSAHKSNVDTIVATIRTVGLSSEERNAIE
jgi:hypothetical protein